MVSETIYYGRDNTFSLQLLRGAQLVNLLSVTAYALHLSDELVFDDPALFNPKPEGVVEISIGELLNEDDMGNYKAYLVTFDPVNLAGVRWPTFKLKVTT